MGADPSTADVAERAVFDFIGQMLETRTVDDDAWTAATDVLGDAGVVDLIGLAGYYAMVAMTLTACRIGADDGNHSNFG